MNDTEKTAMRAAVKESERLWELDTGDPDPDGDFRRHGERIWKASAAYHSQLVREAVEELRQIYLICESNRAIIASHATIIEVREMAHAALSKLRGHGIAD
jgi:hypothetical protein